MNHAAFAWGRRAALDPRRVDALIGATTAARPGPRSCPQTLDEVDRPPRRASSPTTRTRPMPRAIADARRARPRGGGSGRAAARRRSPRRWRASLVQADGLQGRVRGRAALHRRRLPEAGSHAAFEGETCSSTSISRRRSWRAGTRPPGYRARSTFGPWMLKAFGVLARFKGLRGTRLRPLRLQPERRTERQLIADYEALLDEIVARLTPANHAIAVALAAMPAEDPRLRPRQGAQPRHSAGAGG